MDGFGDSFVPNAEGGAPAADVDPAAEFLAREQDQLAGIDDDLVAAAPPGGETVEAVAAPGEIPAGLDGEADLFGGAAPPAMNGGPDLESFEMLGGDEVTGDPPTSAPSEPLGGDPWGVTTSSPSSVLTAETFPKPFGGNEEEEEASLGGFMDPLSSQPASPPTAVAETEGVLSTSEPAVAEFAEAEATAPVRDYSAFGNEFADSSDLAGDASASAGVFSDSAPRETSPQPESARSPVPTIQREEPEKIKIWREEQRVRLEEKDIAEEKAKDELREKAKKELEDWYKQHEEQVAKTRQANRSAEKELVADTNKMEPGTEWERIAKLCDFNPKTAKSSRDISRMRSIILQVKQSPPIKA